MPALVALVCVVLCSALFRSVSGALALGRRESLLAAIVSAGVFATAVAEISSLFSRFGRPAVVGAWILLLIVLSAGYWRARRFSLSPTETSRPIRHLPDQIAILAGLGLLVAAVSLTAAAAAPTNWDSMTYRLPRVEHWIQNAGLFHYPTHVPRQLVLGPGAEILAATLELLAGTGRWVNFIQTLAWLGIVIAASLLARDLGADGPGQMLAAVFAGTLPMAVLQASSTQNDLVLSLWLLVFVHFSLRASSGRWDLTGLLLAGAAAGLALLTKATALFIVFPFGVLLLAASFAPGRVRARKRLAAAAVLSLAVNAGYLTRNLALFGKPLGGEQGTVNSAFLPGLTLSNLSRNSAMELLTPWPAWNASIEGAVLAFHRVLAISASDPRSTWKGAEYHMPARLAGMAPSDAGEDAYAAFHEDEAGNPVHSLTLALAVLVLARRRPLRENRGLWIFLASVSAGFLLFCLVLKWQPWGSRLELPFLVLSAPFVGTVFSRGRAAPSLAAALLLCSVPWALLNATRPLLGSDSVLTTPRLSQSFAVRPGLREPLLRAAREVAAKECGRIGLEIGPDDPEHLIRISLREAGLTKVRVEHVNVKNISARAALSAPFAGFSPCAVITLAPAEALSLSGPLSAKDWDAGRVSVRAMP
jgi:dolichyl-phosphate-mannose-protein mannosyltransferase